MKVVEFDAQGGAPLQIVDEVAVGLVGFGLVDLRQVDEVGAVGQDVVPYGVGVLGGEVAEGGGGGRLERRGDPFTLGFEEDGEGVGADVEGVGDGVLDACKEDRSMGGKLRGKVNNGGQGDIPPALLTWAPMYSFLFIDSTGVLAARGVASSSEALVLRFFGAGFFVSSSIPVGSLFSMSSSSSWAFCLRFDAATFLTITFFSSTTASFLTLAVRVTFFAVLIVCSSTLSSSMLAEVILVAARDFALRVGRLGGHIVEAGRWNWETLEVLRRLKSRMKLRCIRSTSKKKKVVLECSGGRVCRVWLPKL